MKDWLLILVLSSIILFPTQPTFSLSPTLIPPATSYALVGGQNGIWFQAGQAPKLYQFFLANDSVRQLTPIPGDGAVWTGGWNGSQWLISGWGNYPGPKGSDPYLYMYDGQRQIAFDSLKQYDSESSWHGGDIFSVSYNGKQWLLTGMGSGTLQSSMNHPINHLALATFDGNVFKDLSGIIPEQQEGILYASSWNGKYWLVGGGYESTGLLFTYDGATISDITSKIKHAVPSFSSVLSIGWNGNYWLIGGVGFLARYDGDTFLDLTPELAQILPSHPADSVNAIAWDGQSWIIGGGTPVAQLTPSHAWFATYTSPGFVDLSSALPSYVSNGSQSSSILTITSMNGVWVMGGYSGNQGILLAYNDGFVTDYSSLVTGLTYVNWISSLQDLTF